MITLGEISLSPHSELSSPCVVALEWWIPYGIITILVFSILRTGHPLQTTSISIMEKPSSKSLPFVIPLGLTKTFRRTSTQGSSATITFTGNTISVYGTTAADHGLFSVSLDHGPPLIMNGTAPETRYQTLLVRWLLPIVKAIC